MTTDSRNATITVSCARRPCRRYDAITVRITYAADLWAPIGPFRLAEPITPPGAWRKRIHRFPNRFMTDFAERLYHRVIVPNEDSPLPKRSGARSCISCTTSHRPQ